MFSQWFRGGGLEILGECTPNLPSLGLPTPNLSSS